MRIAQLAAVIGAGLLLTACAQTSLSAEPTASSSSAPQARLDSGTIEGANAGGIDSFLGIPFAAPPVGPLRWRAPQPVAPWTGVKKTVAYGHDCMQVPFPSDAAPLGTPPAEDCLYANVWRPTGATGKLPVVVWIYGGGFVNGGASPPTYAGANLAKQGVLFFSFNYRVGRFGTFAHPQLTKANADGGLIGNYGYLDQIAALQWVKRNIAAFGGNPDDVTIIGESAGGMSVHAMVTSPLTKGLFQKAIVMSGGNGQALGAGDLAATEAIGVAFAKSKGIAENDPDALTKLRALSADDVTDGLSMMKLFGGGPRTFASPFVDGKIAVDAGKAYASGAFNHVPMMIGATSGDMGGPTGFMIGGARQASGVIAEKGVPVWEYRFSYVAESLPQGPASHASDIPFFFDTQAIKYGDKTTPRDNAMGKTISAYIANFAKTGDPNGSGLPHWDNYKKATDIIMDFSAGGEAVPQKDPLGAEIDAAAPRS
jgi:para-nitrobenzyl esterase